MFRTLRNHWRGRSSRSTKHANRGAQRYWRPGIELLEDRIMPAYFTQLADGLTAPLTTIQQNLTSSLNSASRIPLVNGHLGDAAQPLTTAFIQQIDSTINVATSNAQLASALTNLGAQNVQVTNIGSPATGVQVDMVLKNTVAKTLDFNVALPGMPIQLLAPGGVQLQAGYNYQLDFGYDSTAGTGVFFDEKVVPPVPVQNPNSLTVSVGASIAGNVHVILGILQGNFTDQNQGPSVTATFSASGIGPGAAPSFNVGGAAQLDLLFQTDQFDGMFFASTNFVLDWGFGPSAPPLLVAFKNVTVNFGGVFKSDAVTELYKQLKDLIPQPVAQLAHLLQTPVPVLSDLWQAIGQPPLTLLQIITQFANGAPLDGLNDVINIVQAIDNLGDEISAAQSAASVNLGNFDLAGEDLSKTALDPRQNTTDNLTNLDPRDVSSPVGIGLITDDPNVDAFVNTCKTFQLSAPLLNDPVNGIFRLLLGQNVPLFKMYGDVNTDIHAKYTFPILGVLQVGIEGDLIPRAHFDLGYDTYGLRQFLADPSANPADLLNGVYVSDDTGISLDARVGAVASLDIVVASLSVDGGIGGKFSVTFGTGAGTDHEHGVTAPEWNQPDVYAFLTAEIAVGFSVFGNFIGWRKSFDIAKVELVGDVPGDHQPLIAQPDPSLPGHLDLLMGPLAHLRQNVGSQSDKDPEDFQVIEGLPDPTLQRGRIVDCGGGPNADSVTVKAFGAVCGFTGVTRIDADGGVGDNTVIVEPGVKAPALLKGGTGSTSANLTYLGTGQASGFITELIGGDGVNKLTAGPANVYMSGGMQGKPNTFSPGSGKTTIIEGTGENDIVFTEPFDPSAIVDTPAGSGPTDLEVIGTVANETISVGRSSSGGIHFDIKSKAGNALGTLDASGVQDLLITGTSSADNVNIDDSNLAGTGLGTIKVHVDNPGDLGSHWILPQFPTNEVTINAPANANALVTNDGTGQILVASLNSPRTMVPVLVGGEEFKLDPSKHETGQTDPGPINANDFFTFRAGGGDTVLNINPNGAAPLVGHIEFDAGPGTTEFTIGLGQFTIDAGNLQNTVIIHANAGATTIIGFGGEANNNITVERNTGSLTVKRDFLDTGSQATITVDSNDGMMQFGGGRATNHNAVDMTLTLKANAGTVQIDSGTDNNVVAVENNRGSVAFTGEADSENEVTVTGNDGILTIDGGAAARSTATTLRNLTIITGTLSLRNTVLTLDDSDETTRGPVSLLLFQSAVDGFLTIPFLLDPTLVALTLITAPLAVVAGQSVDDTVSIFSTPAIPVAIEMGPFVVQGSRKPIGHQGKVYVAGTGGALTVQDAAQVNVGSLGRVNLGGPLTVLGPSLNLDDSGNTTRRVMDVQGDFDDSAATDGAVDEFGQPIVYDVSDPGTLFGLSIEGGPGLADGGAPNILNVWNNADAALTLSHGVVNVYATKLLFPDSGSGKPLGKPVHPQLSHLTIIGGDVVRIQDQDTGGSGILAPVFVTGSAGSVGRLIVDSTVSGYVDTTVTIGTDSNGTGFVRGLTLDRETGRFGTYGRITYTPATVHQLVIRAAALATGLGPGTFNVNDPDVAVTDMNTGSNADHVNVNKLSGQLILEGNASGGTIALNGPLVLNAETAAAIAKTPVGSVLAIVDNRTPVAVTGQFQTAGGAPMPDGTTFTSGGLTLQVHYNAADGDVDAGDGANQDVVLTHLNTPPSVTNLAFAPVEGISSTLSATISDPDLRDVLTVTVNWGDKQLNTFTLPAGVNAFSATHAYPEEIKTPFAVTVAAYDGHGEPPTSASVRITVVDAPTVFVAVGNQTITPRRNPFAALPVPVEGTAFNGAVAVFTDAGSDGTTQDYTANITWGDGTTSAGTVVAGGAGRFNVIGSHTYAEEGTYRRFKVVVTDAGGAVATGKGTETVANAPLSITVPSLTAPEGSTFSGIVAHFTDPGGDGTTRDYQAAVTWGDNSVTSGASVVADDGKGGFNVVASHSFGATTGMPFTVTVLVFDRGTYNAGTGQAQLTDVPLTAQFVPVRATAGRRFTAAVATFTDPGAVFGTGGTATGEYTATIDWGEGNPTPATIVRFAPLGAFTVVGSHTYARTGTFQVTVTIHDRGGSTATAQGIADVAIGIGPT